MDLDLIRKELNKIDRELIDLIAKRQAIMPKIAKYKKENGLLITQNEREKEMFNSFSKLAEEKNINPDLIEGVFRLIVEDSKVIQKEYFDIP